ncbi:MAG TPA: carbohydrate-binding family 9-like protein [Candidatus Dormibacteraeota bacterium]|nr:carbohydrate-binding family 9-like protein [Candidatus Dormibacteraeota bacterium]
MRKAASLLAMVMVVVLWKASRPGVFSFGRAARQVAHAALRDDTAKKCEFSPPGASFSIPHVSEPPRLNTDPHSPAWSHTSSAWMEKDCSRQMDYPKLKTEVRAFWTDSDLYLLFISPYTELNLWLPADSSKDRLKLWDRDVVEFFLGDDWTDIKHYREFEIAPTGDWVDLAIDLNRGSYDANWNSGWQRLGRIDEKEHIWYAAARVPLRSVSEKQVTRGTRWRVNLYRIDGLGADPQRHFMCWQPTCVVNRDPNHVPEHFGTLLFAR